MTFIKERIKLLRKTMRLTQVEFGEKLGIKGNTVTGYETGLREPSNAIISSLCRTFNVDERWLRTGEGDMFVKLSEDEELAGLFAALLREDDSDELSRVKKAFIAELLRLEPAAWEKILEIAKKLADK